MAIENGLVAGMPFQAARWIGGEITPQIVILHDTASGLTPDSAARYLRDNDRGVSVHFVIEHDGSVVQQVPVNRRANHAGRSSYHGRENCNDFSIGIEIVNPGRMMPYNDAKAQTWYGEVFAISMRGIQEVATPEHGHGLWMPYTGAQIDTVIDLLQALFNGVQTLRDITTHWYVSPGRKTDPNPLFPLEQVRSIIFGREDPRDVEANASVVAGRDDHVRITTPGDSLNLRRWPSFNPNVIAAIPHDTIVPVLRRGEFAGHEWLCVRYGGHEGWIVSRHAVPVFRKEHSR
ncbi:N-acetylmuramoyl-L-alanine amidase [Sedimentitalea sp. JM2-8]|uniref:N-acetylmuramoyl-L-alanine amidase n=1 Tax=Sedimentitalea xiamensis TaxID=3050037 RepID=A0ABT7FCA4_9RHOB|nr:N-acetylmuramoyl-L-alanine amidase [Sedimentitalea xiamensis]MDK3072746.1 N-acetylmuramoyl-L-alanine amidase [Sedimentitalea xiamensis]